MPFEWFVALRYMRNEKGQTALILAAISVDIDQPEPSTHDFRQVMFAT